jgi:hypothetical protein
MGMGLESHSGVGMGMGLPITVATTQKLGFPMKAVQTTASRQYQMWIYANSI